MNTFRTELDRFDPDAPIESASTPPSSWYIDPLFEEAERELVFKRQWIAVGRTDQLGDVGAYFCTQVGRDPIVVAVDENREVRAFANSCRHHATRVMEGSGSCREFVCPYHGWTYSLSGRLLRAPGVGGIRNFHPDQIGLPNLDVAIAGPLIFVALSPPPFPLHDLVQPPLSRLADIDELLFTERRVYPVECNWKVFVDNYLDGGYHVAHLHRSLAANLDLSNYRTELFERSSLQSCAGTDSTRIGARADYAWIYPNLMLNRYGPVLDVNIVRPTGPETCEVVFDWYFDPNEASTSFIAESIAASERVQREDIDVCESVQQGLRSSFYDCGRYAPSTERSALQFHRLLFTDLAATTPLLKRSDREGGPPTKEMTHG